MAATSDGVGGEVIEIPSDAVSDLDAADIAWRVFGLDVALLHSLPGERNRNFYVEGEGQGAFVLKFLHPAEPVASTAFHAAILAHLAAHDPLVPAPRIRRTRAAQPGYRWRAPTGAPRSVMCLTYLEGTPLASLGSTPARRQSVGSFVARLNSALGSFTARHHDDGLIWDLQRADRVRSLLVAIAQPSERRLFESVFRRFAAKTQVDLAALPRQAIHNDLNGQNLLMAAHDYEVSGVIDFDDVVVAPVIQDLAVACASHLSSVSRGFEGARDVVLGFGQVRPISLAELAVLPDLIATRWAVEGVVSRWRASRHPENVVYAQRNARADVVVENLRQWACVSDREKRELFTANFG